MIRASRMLPTRLKKNWTIDVLNRLATVEVGGSWNLPEIFSNFRQVCAKVICVECIVTKLVQSDFFTFKY